MRQLFGRLHYLLFRNRYDRELAADMESHRELAARQGHTQIGNPLHLREQARDAWGWTWIDRLFQDLRFAARLLLKSPGFTLAAILMLAIGIGVNVAAFGFFDLLVLRPLNVRDPATLIRFHRRAEPNYAYAVSYPEMAFLRDHATTLSAVLAVNLTRLSVEGEEKQLFVQFVTPNLFRELGGTPVLGRLLDPERDTAPDADPVLVLSYGFWQRHFAADPLVLGKSLRLNGKSGAIVGVAPPHYNGLSMDAPSVWAPITQQPYYAAGSHLLTNFTVESPGVQMWGRLQPGRNPAAAEAELSALAGELHRQHPSDIWEKERLLSEPGGFATSLLIGNRRGTGDEGRDQLYPIFGLAVALVLLILAIACGNLGSLLLARGVAREREITIRVAVGAGRGRLIRQLFTESLLLALAGSAAGLALGFAVLRFLLTATGAPLWLDPIPDWRVIAFSLAAGFLASILFGFAPALQVARNRLHATFFRQFLVGAQVAASCVLLIVAALLGRALNHATSTDPGFEYQHVICVDTGLARNGYSPAKARTYLDSLRSRLSALPGVESVAVVLAPPLGHVTIGTSITADGRKVNVLLNQIDSEFFPTMKTPILLGRNFQPGEAKSVIVGASLARALWPGQNPLGKTLDLAGDRTVIGMAASARMVHPQDSDSAEVYLPIEPGNLPSLSILVRTTGPPEDLVRSVAAAAKATDPATFPEVQLLKSAFRQNVQSAEYIALAVAVFGGVSQLLACLGILGVVSFAVSQRTKEIGIRVALGAHPANVLSIVLRQFAIPVAVGLIAGIALATALSSFLRGLLYGISNLDPATYLAAIAIFLITVALAALIPARRALRVDPIRALRYE